MWANAVVSTETGKSRHGMTLYPGQVFFEFQQVGLYLRCTAIDGKTGVEVVVAGPARDGQNRLKHVAMNKLKYVLNKRASQKTKRC